MKRSIKDFFSKCWSHLLKKSLMENFVFCAAKVKNFKKKFFLFIILVSGQFPPRKIVPQLGLGFGLGLDLELKAVFLGEWNYNGKQFVLQLHAWGQLSQNPSFQPIMNLHKQSPGIVINFFFFLKKKKLKCLF